MYTTCKHVSAQTPTHMHSYPCTHTPTHPHTGTHIHIYIRTHYHLLLAWAPDYISPHIACLIILALIFLVVSSVPRLYFELKTADVYPPRTAPTDLHGGEHHSGLTLSVCALLFQTLRGYHWRGRDCNDSNRLAYPGRR